jgi:DNA-binding NarL/FixJ family response regulator
MISVLLVEHPTAVLRALRETLAEHVDISIVGEASNRARAARLAESLEPDAIVLDAEMPDLDLVATLEELRLHSPSSALVVLTIEPRRVVSSIAEGRAVEVVSKLQGASALPAGIRRAARR